MELSELHKAAIEGMADQIMERTKKWWDKATENLSGMSEKAQKLSLILSAHDGEMHPSYVDAFRQSFGVILGEEIAESVTPAFIPGIAVIPTANTNGHNYEKGEIAVCYKGNAFYTLNNKYGMGNNMEPNLGNLGRPTKEQVIEWLKKYETFRTDMFGQLMEILNSEESNKEEDNE